MPLASIDHMKVAEVLVQILDSQYTQRRNRLAGAYPGCQAAAEIAGDAETCANK